MTNKTTKENPLCKEKITFVMETNNSNHNFQNKNDYIRNHGFASTLWLPNVKATLQYF